MGSAIEATVKALVEFEAELEDAKRDAAEAKRKTSKDAFDWAEAARSSAISKAQEMASRTVAEAKEQAESEADAIRKKGESELRAFESGIAKRKAKAAELVTARLLGEGE